jgi:tetratricopeptide (TPR) repeat protein
MPVAPGTRLDRYEIVALLGTGGMGEVYLARDTRLQRKVALKLLPPAVAADAERMRRFVDEARTTSALNHPNILTVFEAGESGGVHFIATELVDGVTLRDRMARARLDVAAALDVAAQVASALGAAHAAAIVHRDIKPENVMVRSDGVVKVLDFGLAKLLESDRTPGEGPTLTAGTHAGLMMGTVKYMSPEQARGLPVDARSDIFSLGVVLYEMLAGQPPFDGETASDVIAGVLTTEPPSLEHVAPEASHELHHIVAKALRKDRELRYQSVKDLLIDLKDLRQDLEFQARLGAAAPIEHGAEPKHEPRVKDSTHEKPALWITRRWRAVAIGATALALVAVAVLSRVNRAAALTEKDTILLADFVNTTGDPVFDGALKQGLALQIGQSPFLNIFPDERVRQTLRLMGRPPDERVTKETAREICQREGIKAFLAGSINNLGSHYVVALEAINSQSGAMIGGAQIEADSKEQVLKALSQAASRTRERLGESLSSIQKFDAPLEVTTSSLDALKAWSMGSEQSIKGKYLEAIPFYKRAVELDPNFAYAYASLSAIHTNTNQPGLAAQYADKAFTLRDRVSEPEKLRIAYFYYRRVMGDANKAIEVLELSRQTYPRDYRAPANLSDLYLGIGQFEKALEAARDSVRLNPNSAPARTNLGQALIGLNRFAEAREVFEQALQQKLDTASYHTGLYQIAFVNGDRAAIKQQLDWAVGKPSEYIAPDWQAQTEAFAGHDLRAQEFSHRAIDLAAHRNLAEVAARYAAEQALRGAVFGECGQARSDVRHALDVARAYVSLTRGGLALALCGEVGQAQSIVDELTKRYPTDTLINSLWLPTMTAAIELRQNKPAAAIESLRAASRYEAAGEFWSQYVRGLAYLLQGAGKDAAAEFQKILDHRGQAPLSALYPLAHLGLARASAASGHAQATRKAYQDFLSLWTDADSTLPVLVAAKGEYERLLHAQSRGGDNASTLTGSGILFLHLRAVPIPS